MGFNSAFKELMPPEFSHLLDHLPLCHSYLKVHRSEVSKETVRAATYCRSQCSERFNIWSRFFSTL